MVVKTLNSLYSFEDKGDGAFLVEVLSGDRSKRLYFRRPTLMRLHHGPVVGEVVWGTFQEGPKKDRAFHTSRVVSITL